MIAEGRIVIDLSRNGDVRLTSNRGADVARLLVGRDPREALDLLPRLFSLCGHAHVAAARVAVQEDVTEAEAHADTSRVLAETAREHLLRILTGWRVEGAGFELPSPPVMGLVKNMQAAVGDPAEERQVSALLAGYLETHVFGISPAAFLKLRDLAEFTNWLDGGPTLAKAYLCQIVAHGWQGLGAVSTQFLPALSGAQLQALMAEPSFTLRPEWHGQPHETGPLARQSRHPVVAALLELHGAGLMSRLVARLVDLAKIPTQMTTGESPVRGQPGVGVVETARGRLVHAARQEHGQLKDYQILAPTEWNFHPEGVAVQALAGLHAVTGRAEGAQALIEAIDPCVAFEVRAA